MCVCVPILSDRDIGPLFCASSESITILCIFIYANTTWIISLSAFPSLSPKVSSLITSIQLARNIFRINYLLRLWRWCETHSGVGAQTALKNANNKCDANLNVQLCAKCLALSVLRYFKLKASAYHQGITTHVKTKTCTHRPNTPSHKLLLTHTQTHTQAAVWVLVVACGPVVFELPLRLQSVQIHYERPSSLPAESTATQTHKKKERNTCTQKTQRWADSRAYTCTETQIHIHTNGSALWISAP